MNRDLLALPRKRLTGSPLVCMARGVVRLATRQSCSAFRRSVELEPVRAETPIARFKDPKAIQRVFSRGGGCP